MSTEKYLGTLLAVLHGDGGHYLGEWGSEKATRDALEKYYGLVMELDRVRNEKERYEDVLKTIGSYWAQPARDLARIILKEVRGYGEEQDKETGEE